MELGLRRSRRGTDFKPPMDNRVVLGLMRCFLPLALKASFRIAGFDIDAGSIERLRSLKGQRVVLVPNHPTDRDFAVMFHLSRVLGETFNFLAARELFDSAPVSWILQRCGVYSVRRGTNDRKSFSTTVQLLVQGRKKLVIFPEGITCWQNDTVLPFEEGVSLFGFWALEKLSSEPGASLHLVPVAIKYIHARNMVSRIDRSLRRLEKRLDLASGDRGLYDRLRSAGEAVLSSAEKEYGIRPGSGADFGARLENAKEVLIARIANAIGVRFSLDQVLSSRIRVLVNALNDIVQEGQGGSEYQMGLHRERKAELDHLYDDLSRVLGFIATHDGYVKETMSTERFFDVIGQLEREVFGRRGKREPSRVYLRVGEPVDLSQHFDEYRKNRRAVLTRVTRLLEDRVRSMLTDLGRHATPLPAS